MNLAEPGALHAVIDFEPAVDELAMVVRARGSSFGVGVDLAERRRQ